MSAAAFAEYVACRLPAHLAARITTTGGGCTALEITGVSHTESDPLILITDGNLSAPDADSPIVAAYLSTYEVADAEILLDTTHLASIGIPHHVAGDVLARRMAFDFDQRA